MVTRGPSIVLVTTSVLWSVIHHKRAGRFYLGKYLGVCFLHGRYRHERNCPPRTRASTSTSLLRHARQAPSRVRMSPGSASSHFLVAFALSDSPSSLSPNFRVILLRLLLYHTGEGKANMIYSVDHGPASPARRSAVPQRPQCLAGAPSDDGWYGHPGLVSGGAPGLQDRARTLSEPEKHSSARPSLETNAEVALSSTLPEKRRIMRARFPVPTATSAIQSTSPWH
jgi:hypothetical protein